MLFLIRPAIRIALISLVIVAAVQPYNWFCQITQKCDSFYFSQYLPKMKGKIPFDVMMEVTNYREDLDFRPTEPVIVTLSNQTNVVFYHAKNLSDKTISFRPQLIIEPDYAAKYFNRYECLCSHEYKLKPREERKLKMVFEIKKDIENEKNFSKQPNTNKLKVRYKI